MYYSPLPCYLLPLRPKYSPQHPILGICLYCACIKILSCLLLYKQITLDTFHFQYYNCTLEILAVAVDTVRFNVQNFCVPITFVRLCFVWVPKQNSFFPYSAISVHLTSLYDTCTDLMYIEPCIIVITEE